MAETTTETDALREAATDALRPFHEPPHGPLAAWMVEADAARIADAILSAVLPLHEKQVREQVAAEIEKHRTEGLWNRDYLHGLLVATRIARGDSR